MRRTHAPSRPAGASSNGRTWDFESHYDGSNPSAPTITSEVTMARLSGAFLVAVAVLVPARSARAEKITIMVGGIEKQIYLPAKLAEQLGYFKEQGLEVELLSEPAGVQAENAMLAGREPGGGGFYVHFHGLQAHGKVPGFLVQFCPPAGPGGRVSRQNS